MTFDFPLATELSGGSEISGGTADTVIGFKLYVLGEQPYRVIVFSAFVPKT